MVLFIAIFIFAIVIMFVIALISMFNGLVGLKNQLERAWSNIDVILKQRHDEIPQLVKVIEQYASYERGTIDRLVEARTRYGAARNLNEKVQASQEMSLALSGVMAIGENYPELKSNAQFVQLQSRISSLEERIADRRESFNEAVTNFNTRMAQFPDMFFAGMLGYSRQDMFKIDAGDTAAPSLAMKLPA